MAAMQTLEEVGRELLEDIAAGRIEGGSYGRMMEWIARLAANDLIPPFERQWAFLDHLRTHSPLRDLPFVLMSTNERLARTLADREEPDIEVVGRPFEFPVLLDAVRRAIGGAAA